MRTVNVKMLPTKEANRLIMYGEVNGVLDYVKLPTNYLYGFQHLYFTSDEEVKKGEYVTDGVYTQKAPFDVDKDIAGNRKWRKIVATTDPALHTKVNDGSMENQKFASNLWHIPQIPESFILKYIEIFNAGTPITQVQLEEEPVYRSSVWTFEEPESFRLKLRSDNTVIVHPIKERTFTEADLKNAFLGGFVAGQRLLKNLTHEEISKEADYYISIYHPQ